MPLGVQPASLPLPATAPAPGPTPLPQQLVPFQLNQPALPPLVVHHPEPRPTKRAKRQGSPSNHRRTSSARYSTAYTTFGKLPHSSKLELLQAMEPEGMNVCYMGSASVEEVHAALFVATGKRPEDKLDFHDKMKQVEACCLEHRRRGAPLKGKTREDILRDAQAFGVAFGGAYGGGATACGGASGEAFELLLGPAGEQFLKSSQGQLQPLPRGAAAWALGTDASGRFYISDGSQSQWASDLFPQIPPQPAPSPTLTTANASVCVNVARTGCALPGALPGLQMQQQQQQQQPHFSAATNFTASAGPSGLQPPAALPAGSLASNPGTFCAQPTADKPMPDAGRLQLQQQGAQPAQPPQPPPPPSADKQPAGPKTTLHATPDGKMYAHSPEHKGSRWLHRASSGGADDYRVYSNATDNKEYIASPSQQAPAIWVDTLFEASVQGMVGDAQITMQAPADE